MTLSGNDALIQKCLILPASDSDCSIIIVACNILSSDQRTVYCSNLLRSNIHTVLRNPDEVSQSVS